MSTWGYDIFDNDEANDIRTFFEAEMQTRASVPHATAEILREANESLDDPESGPIVWLALAAVQLSYGGLQPNVRDHALAVIESGEDLRQWEARGSTEDVEGRKRVLDDLKARLMEHA